MIKKGKLGDAQRLAAQRRKKKKKKLNDDYERCLRSVRMYDGRVYMPPPNDDYRDNYKRIFGHE